MSMLCSHFHQRRRGGDSEAGMEEGMEMGSRAAAKKQLTGFGKAARRKRIFARLREGWAYDEIAREEQITSRRARQIVAEALQRREVDDGADHALLQLSRLEPALRVASEAVGKGDVKAIAPLIKVLDFQVKAEAILEKQRARREADEAEAGAEDGQGAPLQAEAPRPESGADVAAPPPEAGKKDFFPL